jgi:broad specificity phosphatase PhoE
MCTPVIALVLLAVVTPLSGAQNAAGGSASGGESQVIFVVRHAERDDGGAGTNPMLDPDDPMLSAAGVDRARALASLLRRAGIKRIYTSEFKRTKQTAGPAAAGASVSITVVPAGDTDALVRQVLEARGAGPALVVGHSNTIPDIVRLLGVAQPISIPDGEYDNLFIVVRAPAGPATLVRLKY